MIRIASSSAEDRPDIVAPYQRVKPTSRRYALARRRERRCCLWPRHGCDPATPPAATGSVSLIPITVAASPLGELGVRDRCGRHDASRSPGRGISSSSRAKSPPIRARRSTRSDAVTLPLRISTPSPNGRHEDGEGSCYCDLVEINDWGAFEIVEALSGELATLLRQKSTSAYLVRARMATWRSVRPSAIPTLTMSRCTARWTISGESSAIPRRTRRCGVARTPPWNFPGAPARRARQRSSNGLGGARARARSIPRSRRRGGKCGRPSNARPNEIAGPPSFGTMADGTTEGRRNAAAACGPHAAVAVETGVSVAVQASSWVQAGSAGRPRMPRREPRQTSTFRQPMDRLPDPAQASVKPGRRIVPKEGCPGGEHADGVGRGRGCHGSQAWDPAAFRPVRANAR